MKKGNIYEYTLSKGCNQNYDRDVRFASITQWVPQISAITFTIITYIWKKNSLVSIFGGTIIYMILIRVL